MVDRRQFIKESLCAAMVLTSGTLFQACSGLKRADVSDIESQDPRLPHLDRRARLILHYASLAPSGHNSQPWRVRIEGLHRWVIEADATRRLPCVDPENRELLLSLGAFVENLSLAAGTLGLATEIQPLAGNNDDRDILRVILHDDVPHEYPLSRMQRRRTVKHGHLAQALSANHVNALHQQMHGQGQLFYFPKSAAHAACIRDAAIENYRIQAERDDAQRELVRWLRLTDQAARRHRDGLSTEGMEITGVKGWIVRHFVAPDDFLKPSYRQQGVDLMASLADQGAGWIVIGSQGTSVDELIATGRRFQRVALLARDLGIAIHPMTQMLEEKHGQAQIAAHHDGRFTPQFILRVGYIGKYPEPVSLRRPVEWFVYA